MGLCLWRLPPQEANPPRDTNTNVVFIPGVVVVPTWHLRPRILPVGLLARCGLGPVPINGKAESLVDPAGLVAPHGPRGWNRNLKQLVLLT